MIAETALDKALTLYLLKISVSKTVEELILEWKENKPITTGNLGMSQFELTNIVADKCHESFQIGACLTRRKKTAF